MDRILERTFAGRNFCPYKLYWISISFFTIFLSIHSLLCLLLLHVVVCDSDATTRLGSIFTIVIQFVLDAFLFTIGGYTQPIDLARGQWKTSFGGPLRPLISTNVLLLRFGIEIEMIVKLIPLWVFLCVGCDWVSGAVVVGLLDQNIYLCT